MWLRSITSRSNMLSIAMVLAAGGITWYGLSAAQPEPAPTAPTPADVPMVPPAADRELPRGGGDADGEAQADAPRAGLPTRVVVSSAGIDAPIRGVGIVTEGGEARWETADAAVGHHVESAMPGNPGNLVLSGHVSVASPDAVPYFANLADVAIGDIVEVHSGNSVFRYRIEDLQEVSPDTTRVLRSDHRSRVTLITCTPDLADRVVVVGKLVT